MNLAQSDIDTILTAVQREADRLRLRDADIARITGLHRSTVRRVLDRAYDPKAEVLASLARAVGLEVRAS